MSFIHDVFAGLKYFKNLQCRRGLVQWIDKSIVDQLVIYDSGSTIKRKKPYKHSLHLKIVVLLWAQAVGEVRPPVEVDRQLDRCSLATFVASGRLFRWVGRQRRLLDDDRGHLSCVRHDHRGRLALVDDQRVQQHCRALPFLVVPVRRSAVHGWRPPGNRKTWESRDDYSHYNNYEDGW